MKDTYFTPLIDIEYIDVFDVITKSDDPTEDPNDPIRFPIRE